MLPTNRLFVNKLERPVRAREIIPIRRPPDDIPQRLDCKASIRHIKGQDFAVRAGNADRTGVPLG